MTEWRDIPGFPNHQASSTGEIRSRPRFVRQGNRWGQQVERRQAGRVLATQVNPDTGYVQVRAGHTKAVHVLVAAAFHGPRPTGLQVRHLDGDKFNNSPSNLTYGTNSENQHDAVRHGTHKEARKKTCPRGHLLVEPNLVKHEAAKGRRRCRSCARAQNYVVKHPSARVDLSLVADRYYAELALSETESAA